jgi:hypothetical protein
MAIHILTRAGAALVVASLALVLTPTPPAAADPTAANAMACAVNEVRVTYGRPVLRVADDLAAVAQRHSERMANQSSLHHNPNLSTEVTGWRRLAENVGVGTSVGSVQRSFLGSDAHRANILDQSTTEMGIGVEVRAGRLWVTQVFRTPSGSGQGSRPLCPAEPWLAFTASVPDDAIPLAGDWNGDGSPTPGWFRDGIFTLVPHRDATKAIEFRFGRTGDTPLVGDWNRDGRTTIGVHRDREWILRNHNSAGTPATRFTYGLPTDTPLVGDWNRDGRTTIGVHRDRDWILRTAAGGGAADLRFTESR